jgi:hypothetical protein
MQGSFSCPGLFDTHQSRTLEHASGVACTDKARFQHTGGVLQESGKDVIREVRSSSPGFVLLEERQLTMEMICTI